MFHGTISFQNAYRTSNRGLFLTNRHIDTNKIFPFLIDNGIESQGCFTRLTIANNQLALTASNGDHSIDGFNAGLDRCIHILTLHDARRNTLDRPKTGCGNGSLPVDGLAQRVDHPSDHGVPYRHGCNPPCPAYQHSFGDPPVVPHYDYTDAIFSKVERCSHHPVSKLNQFLCFYICEPVNTSDTITCLSYCTDVANIKLRLKSLDLSLQISRDLLNQVCHEVLRAKFLLRTRARIRHLSGRIWHFLFKLPWKSYIIREKPS